MLSKASIDRPQQRFQAVQDKLKLQDHHHGYYFELEVALHAKNYDEKMLAAFGIVATGLLDVSDNKFKDMVNQVPGMRYEEEGIIVGKALDGAVYHLLGLKNSMYLADVIVDEAIKDANAAVMSAAHRATTTANSMTPAAVNSMTQDNESGWPCVTIFLDMHRQRFLDAYGSLEIQSDHYSDELEQAIWAENYDEKRLAALDLLATGLYNDVNMQDMVNRARCMQLEDRHARKLPFCLSASIYFADVVVQEALNKANEEIMKSKPKAAKKKVATKAKSKAATKKVATKAKPKTAMKKVMTKAKPKAATKAATKAK